MLCTLGTCTYSTFKWLISIHIKWFFYFVCSGEQPNIVWTGYGKKTPVLIFSAQNIVNRKPEIKAIGGGSTYCIPCLFIRLVFYSKPKIFTNKLYLKSIYCDSFPVILCTKILLESRESNLWNSISLSLFLFLKWKAPIILTPNFSCL